jgi:hypothetical protein
MDPSTPSNEDPTNVGLKRLSIAVIQKAVEDLQIRATGNDFRDRDLISAKEFLLVANEDLAFWCDLCGFNMQAVVDRSNRIIRRLQK